MHPMVPRVSYCFQYGLVVGSPNQPDRWLGLEFRHVAALDAVARTGSFGRAAAELGYSQPAVSQQIAALERIVGEKLVERPGGPRHATLTEAGELLLRHAAAIVARVDAARADIDALRAGSAGRLRIGSYQSIGARLLPEVMRRFLADWPDVDIGLLEPATDEELCGLLERGEIDLAFCSLPLPEGPFEAFEVMSDEYIFLVPAGSELAERGTAAPDELAGMPMIGCAASGEKLVEALRAGGYPAQFAFRSDNNGTLQGLVGAGFGAALIPALAVAPGDERVRVIGVEAPIPPRRLAVAWHRDRHHSRAARAFVAMAREVCSLIEQDLPWLAAS
jgi:molybdate transport repressor ModE-like protein